MTIQLDRRTFLKSAAALGAIPALGVCAAQANSVLQYTPGLIQSRLAQGETVFVDYSAVWCGTCRRQERVVSQLRNENPAYNSAMTFVRVDWDQYRTHAVTTSRSIPRRSTLLVLKGDQELGRIVAGTGQAQIKELMDLGL